MAAPFTTKQFDLTDGNTATVAETITPEGTRTTVTFSIPQAESTSQWMRALGSRIQVDTMLFAETGKFTAGGAFGEIISEMFSGKGWSEPPPSQPPSGGMGGTPVRPPHAPDSGSGAVDRYRTMGTSGSTPLNPWNRGG